MAKDKNSLKTVNFNFVQKTINIIYFGSIGVILLFLLLLFLITYYQLKKENIHLIEEKKNQIFKIYTNDVFQRIQLLSNSTPFVDYLNSGPFSRSELENEVLSNFSHYISEEITGFQLVDTTFKNILEVGKKSDAYVLLKLCYINGKLDINYGRCLGNIYVYFDKNLMFEKIKKIEPTVLACKNCTPYLINNGEVIHDLYVIKNNNVAIAFTVKVQSYINTFIWVIAVVFFIMLICFVSYYLNKRYLKKYIYVPLNKLFDFVINNSNRGDFCLEEVEGIANKIDALKAEIILKEKLKKQNELTRLAQVAHDIRSPLIALNSFFTKNLELPEDSRIMLRSALQRMQDIANNLILQHQNIINEDENKNANVLDEELSSQLISSLMDSLISEKRLQYRDNLGVEIQGSFGENAYGLFAKIQPKEFKRVLSNLINNAVESLQSRGSVSVELSSHLERVFLNIIDNGKGIPPEILPKLMNHGATFEKKGGSGFGLYHAKTTVEKWNGKLDITSDVGKGTKVCLSLPRVLEPYWFVSVLEIEKNSTIAVIDDDASIHNIWNERFHNALSNEKSIAIIHFSNPTDVINWYEKRENEQNNKTLFLCDYEFINHSLNGIDLIQKLKIERQSVLVTSRYEDEGFPDHCNKLGIKMIPKGLTFYVPISVIEAEAKQKIDAILIDDDDIIHMNWKASSIDKQVAYYFNSHDFFKECAKYDSNTPIYIDYNLNEDLKGDEIAKKIYNAGFKNIILATLCPLGHFKKMEWIKEVRDKDPPWIC